MRKLLLASILLIPISAFTKPNTDKTFGKAKTLTCVFTEPFRDVKIDLATLSGVLFEKSLNQKIILKSIEMKKVESGMYSFTSAKLSGLVVDLNQKGSDGMNNLDYPFSGKLGSQEGGCSTDQVKPTPSEDMGDRV